MHVHSFAPIAGPSARCLVLGSMPGKASLAAGEYYAHPRNLFWPLMELLLAVPVAAAYQERCDRLGARGVAVWDVLKTCTRATSLDSDIVTSSIVANDFEAFFAVHPRIEAIFFNGATAAQVYARHVRPVLPPAMAAIATTGLPSTSPANASIPRAVKVARWRELADRV